MEPGKAVRAAECIDPRRRPTLNPVPGALARLRQFRDIDSALVDRWDELATEAAEPNPFLESWYCLPGHDLFCAGAECRLLTVETDHGRLLGVLPLVLRDAYGRIPVSYVANWSHANVFLGTPLVRKGSEIGFWAGALACLDNSAWASSFLHLEHLNEGGRVHRGLQLAARQLNRSCDVVLREDRPFADTTLCAEDYIRGNLNAKRRSEYRRKRKRLAELGNLVVTELSNPAQADEWIADFLELEAKGWKGKAGSALASQKETVDLFTSVVRNAFALGRLHFVRMDLDDQPIAMQTSLISSPGAFGYKACFDESYARYSAGMLLQLDAFALIDRPGIAWQDSCAAPRHPVGSIWSERRSIVRVTVPLAGIKRKLAHLLARTAERGAQVARTATGLVAKGA